MNNKSFYMTPETDVLQMEADNNLLQTSVKLPGTSWQDEKEL